MSHDCDDDPDPISPSAASDAPPRRPDAIEVERLTSAFFRRNERSGWLETVAMMLLVVLCVALVAILNHVFRL